MNDIDELDRLYQETKRKTWTFDRSVNEIDYKDVRSVFKVAARYEAEAAARYAVAVANAWPAISARLRAAEAEVARLRGEVASLALLVNPQAARDAAQEARENRAARAILATREGDDLVGAATNAMAMTELYKAMWRRDQAYAGLARQAMTDGLAECERLRGALRNVRDDYDCDGVGTGGLECRHCIALAALGEP